MRFSSGDLVRHALGAESKADTKLDSALSSHAKPAAWGRTAEKRPSNQDRRLRDAGSRPGMTWQDVETTT